MSLDIEDQYDKIYKYCYFKVNNPQLAEDLTQETFLKYFSQNSYINRGKLLAYLYTIAKNLCMDTYKKKENLLLNDEIPSENTIDEFETNFAMKQAIATLSDDLQEIILLRYANDLSMNEISNITGLSRFSIHRKVNKALKQLKLVIRKEDFLE
ncbi:DNA-directed RNA polymerase sigma-70 factor [Vallitalea longa]|uniref:DNA-directed RNA polymerase sigma-70 factor n=1 Tax=Vallitalea longa TaxID=2936439 RepID=A0A9W6DER8_9FIRM|nr:RNA polymerase sigma factor [Vallitalea longa]GKX28728.1 DNA-directed RNA polymerase sigma-70 factor [Vallitalea longa]